MTTIAVQAPYTPKPRCPKCANAHEIRGEAPSASGQRKYDVLSDTYGGCVCPACHHRGAWVDFHTSAELTTT